jgi:hypothetical protein
MDKIGKIGQPPTKVENPRGGKSRPRLSKPLKQAAIYPFRGDIIK